MKKSNLNAQIIHSFLKNSSIQLDILNEVTSTNDYLKNYSIKKDPVICIAETQTKGRGRMGRAWHSPFGENIYLSLRYSFQKNLNQLSSLSLVVALAMCKAIETYIQLKHPLLIKWPNDVMINQKKLGGNLIEVLHHSHNFCQVIIGIGINVNMTQDQNTISQPWTSLSELTHKVQDRNSLCAKLIEQLLNYLEKFNKKNLKNFLEEWNKRDYLKNQPIRLSSDHAIFEGVGDGINDLGQLILKMKNGEKKAFSAGEVRILK